MNQSPRCSPSRRIFVRNAALAAAGFYIVPRHVLGGSGLYRSQRPGNGWHRGGGRQGQEKYC